MKRSFDLGRTLIIANPKSQAGAGRAVAERLRRFLALYLDDADAFDLVATERPRHATEIAAQATGYATVIALGGDGLIHEVVNGLMAHDPASRPTLGIVPVGSGNDYALTLGIDDFSGSDFARLLTCRPQTMDIGRAVLEQPGGESVQYFMETLSVGLDAAIAMETYTLRHTTKLTGNALYTAAGLKVFGSGYRTFPMAAAFDGGELSKIKPHLIALQIGPTYGSGFQICPDADPRDGLFDVCYADGPTPCIITLPIFLKAKKGGHVGSEIIHMLQARHVELELGGVDYPIQMDGEEARATRIVADVLPEALSVLRPIDRADGTGA